MATSDSRASRLADWPIGRSIESAGAHILSIHPCFHDTLSGTTPTSGSSWCLECDAPHSPKACPQARGLYPPEVAARLPQVEAWMAARLGRVQTLDRARASP